ncbi:MAG: magnesium chelatase family protein [Verrucomicrobiales bacterium]|jgi:magnesium chelatase family protein
MPLWLATSPQISPAHRWPLLDRIDIHFEVPIVDHKELSGKATGEPSEAIRFRVENVREMQLERFVSDGNETGAVTTNITMTPRLMKAHCQLDAESAGLLE